MQLNLVKISDLVFNQETPRPESEGAEAAAEALYDDFPDNKPP